MSKLRRSTVILVSAMALGACLGNDRRSEGDPDRAAFCDRFPRIANAYVRETIAERCRSGAAAVGEHYPDRLLGVPYYGGVDELGETSAGLS